MAYYTLNDIAYLAANCNADQATLHWSGGSYTNTSPYYHLNILGDGRVWSDFNSFDVAGKHTWHRNTGNIGISILCCADASVNTEGNVTWGSVPPTDAQVNKMAMIVKTICEAKGWDITYDRIKTHNDWAKIDGYSIYDNDPDIRWDLIALPQESGDGGDIIRGKAIWYHYHPEECTD